MKAEDLPPAYIELLRQVDREEELAKAARAQSQSNELVEVDADRPVTQNWMNSAAADVHQPKESQMPRHEEDEPNDGRSWLQKP